MQPQPLIATLQGAAHAPNAPGVMDFFLQSGPMAKIVLGILVLCSLASWAVILNKYFLLRRADRQTREFLKVFHRSNRFSEVNSATERLSTSPLVGIFQAGYAEIDTQIKAAGDAEKSSSRYLIQSVKAVERSLQRSIRGELASLSRGTQILATTAAAAPFIGLFGTVWGIMIAFGDIGASGSTSITTRRPGHRRSAGQHRRWAGRCHSRPHRLQLLCPALARDQASDGRLRPRVHQSGGTELHVSPDGFPIQRR